MFSMLKVFSKALGLLLAPKLAPRDAGYLAGAPLIGQSAHAEQPARHASTKSSSRTTTPSPVAPAAPRIVLRGLL